MKRGGASQSAFINLRVRICCALVCAVAASVHAGNIVVTNTNDSGPGSLRQALADANDGDTITFAVTGTISLTSGELLVNKSITISGPGAANLTVDGNPNGPVFHISSRVVSISGLTITHGNGGGVWNDHGALVMNACSLIHNVASSGGGILNDHATLTLSDCTVNQNGAGDGGGIYNNGQEGRATVTIFNSTVSSNSALHGAGIFNDNATLRIVNSTVSLNSAREAGGILNNATSSPNDAILTILNSTITSNSADYFAGGIANDGTMTIVNSTISNNRTGGGSPPRGGQGGGIFNAGILTISNSTLSGNAAVGNMLKGPGLGGGVLNLWQLEIANTTLSDNVADDGGSIYNITNFLGNSASFGGGACKFLGQTQATVGLANTVLKAGATGGNIVNFNGVIISHGYNLSSDDAGGFLNGPGDQINTDPMLGPLQDNGGPTFTHELLPGSPAIDAGDPNFVPPPFYDQRGAGFYRVMNGRIDKGSFEVQAGPTPTPMPTPRPAPPPRPRPTPR